MKFNFTGVISALVTPFYHQEVDYESLEKLVRFQLKAGVQGFVVNGTTAESPTLSSEEVEKIYTCVKQVVQDSVPVILGTGSNSTQETKESTLWAEKLGADAALVVVPYYNKPPQRGLVQHFIKVSQATSLPIILYNVPGRTITSMSLDTVLELAKQKNIIGIKEASGDLVFDLEIQKNVSPEFVLLSGDDPTFLSFLKQGGHGIISVMSNLIPSAAVAWQKLMSQKKFEEALVDFEKYKNLIQLMYVEANPIPIKWMLYKQGLLRSAEMRLPLAELDVKYQASIQEEMKKLGLI